jgi:uncharacterized membrane protein YkvA (DUF1232 family)/plasmid maintenance system antidote protein VapI
VVTAVVADFGQFLQAQLASRGWNYSHFAMVSGLHVSLISRVLRGERAPSVNFARKTAAALGLPLETVMAAAGLYTDALAETGTQEAAALTPYVQYAATPEGEAELAQRLPAKLERIRAVEDPTGRIGLLLEKAALLWTRFQQSGGAVRTLIGGALLYFVSPVDLVPDFLPLAGLMDDLAVLTLVMGLISGRTANDL